MSGSTEIALRSPEAFALLRGLRLIVPPYGFRVNMRICETNLLHHLFTNTCIIANSTMLKWTIEELQKTTAGENERH